MICEDGIFYEQQGKINYMSANGKVYTACDVMGNGTQKLQFQDGVLTIYFYSGIQQVGWMEHADTEGGMSETWYDIYETTIETERKRVNADYLKELV